MAVAANSDPKRRVTYEPLYDIDPRTGANIEVFYADPALAESIGKAGPGWFWRACQRGDLPNGPTGPFGTSYTAYRDALGTA
ncbi:MAG: hypothetical protein ABSE22_00555 [Xanthobacteraceae bacterium]